MCVYVCNPFWRLLFCWSLRLAARPAGMWFGLGCFVLTTDHTVGANALIPFTGCAAVVTIVYGVSMCGWYCVLLYVQLNCVRVGGLVVCCF